MILLNYILYFYKLGHRPMTAILMGNDIAFVCLRVNCHCGWMDLRCAVLTYTLTWYSLFRNVKHITMYARAISISSQLAAMLIQQGGSKLRGHLTDMRIFKTSHKPKHTQVCVLIWWQTATMKPNKTSEYWWGNPASYDTDESPDKLVLLSFSNKSGLLETGR